MSGTRAALGAGVGLLTADLLSTERRKGVGWTLLSVGLISTIPIAIQLAYGNGRRSECEEASPLAEEDL